MADYEKILKRTDAFPVEVFIQDNLRQRMHVNEHYHDCLEVLYFMSDNAIQQINGITTTPKNGDLIIIKNGDIHSTYCEKSGDCRILVLKFFPEMLDPIYAGETALSLLSAFKNSTTKNIASVNSQQRQNLTDILVAIHHEYTVRQMAYEMRIKGYIYEFVSLLLRYGLIAMPIEGDNRITQKEMETLSSLLTYIEQNFSSQITLKDISNILHLNYSYTSRYFKRLTKKTFQEYLNYVRIVNAEKLLILRQYQISDIAIRCGFQSHEAFIRSYRKLRGFPPSFLTKKVK